MGNVPVLKSREVASILEAMGFVNVCQRGSQCNTDILTVGVQPFLFMRAAISHPSFSSIQ